jgi:predicted amidohydrolase YtcJ
MDYIFTNGFIFNTQKQSLEELSLLVCKDRISWIGNFSDCKLAAKHAFETIDLKQKLLLPAFTDAHTHFVEYAKSRFWLIFSSVLGCIVSYLIISEIDCPGIRLDSGGKLDKKGGRPNI